MQLIDSHRGHRPTSIVVGIAAAAAIALVVA